MWYLLYILAYIISSLKAGLSLWNLSSNSMHGKNRLIF